MRQPKSNKEKNIYTRVSIYSDTRGTFNMCSRSQTPVTTANEAVTQQQLDWRDDSSQSQSIPHSNTTHCIT